MGKAFNVFPSIRVLCPQNQGIIKVGCPGPHWCSTSRYAVSTYCPCPLLSICQCLQPNFSGKDKGTRTANATMLTLSPEVCQESFLGNKVRTELETVINFPSEQSIKVSQPRSGPYCRCEGHNYIVKKWSCPGWLNPPVKLTCDWQAVYGWHALTGRGVG